ncbi:hypothetical protein [Rhodococcus indonesiensis]
MDRVVAVAAGRAAATLVATARLRSRTTTSARSAMCSPAPA